MPRKLANLPTHGEVVAQELGDEGFRREWERLSLARAVAARLIAYRADHGLSQRKLAERLGIHQPQVARLEIGEHEPSHETLARISNALEIEFTISITPTRRAPTQLTRRAREQVIASYQSADATVRLTAS